ncbi:MAG: hypothetical protein KDA89_21060, partial [Planctomycetaceae bacterium]|nr:hypothetical protein [Planctomycetaceae bacterium]
MGTRSGRLILVATLLLSLQQSASLPRVRGGEGNESVSGALPAGTLRQRYQIAADVLSSSVAESLRRPIVTPLRSIGRTCERIAGRAGVIGYRLAPKLADQAAQRRHTRREDDSVCLTSGSVTLLPSSEACVSELLSRLDTATVQ